MNKEKTICLNMIVRNEAAVIGRCLASVLPVIDYWVICDTGSTDGTPAVIADALASVPGEIHHHVWVNFGVNRAVRLEPSQRSRICYETLCIVIGRHPNGDTRRNC